MPRPRILVADDHAEMRARVTTLLASEFDVVATVADGQAALDAIQSLHPDLVVLDISMPVLSGFGAAAKIRHLAQPPKIVFLTSYDDAELREAGMLLGACGIVLKRNMTAELKTMVRRCLAQHGVLLFEDAHSFARGVADFICQGWVANEPAILAARPSHVAAVFDRMSMLHFDPRRRIADGDLLVLDAGDTLSRLMVDDMPCAERFEAEMVPVIERMAGVPPRPLRACGEMVDLLWASGKYEAADRLETMWDGLRDRYVFSLLCGYSHHAPAEASFELIRRHHDYISSAAET